MRLIIGTALGLTLAACTDGELTGMQAAGTWAAVSANAVGAPFDCVERSSIRGQAARDARTLDVTLDDGRLLRNRLPYACPGLGRENRLLYRTSTERVCSTDSITLVLANGQPGTSCGLGRFQQIVIPPQPGPTR